MKSKEFALAAALVAMLLPAQTAHAQQNPLSDNARMMYGVLKFWVLGSAQKMPEDKYNFRPAEPVRTFGQLIGHVADAQYRFCSVALGEKNPAPAVEKTRSSKAELISALKDAFAFCDRAYNGMTDEAGMQIIPLDGRDFPRIGVLDVNSMHTTEHYGNLIVYLRINGLVPPSSDPAYAPPVPPKKSAS